MYLITIAMAAEDGHEGPVPVPRLAEALAVSRVSANEMVKKLADRRLVDYVPYQGAELTPAGESIAAAVLRRRRLWATFLADHLGLSPAAADAVACEFEHVTTAQVTDLLAKFLGDPAVGPQGKPIPVEAAQEPPPAGLPLAEFDTGLPVLVLRVDGDEVVRSFLAAEGVASHQRVRVIARSEDGGLLLEAAHGHVHVTPDLATAVMAVPVTD